MFNWLRWGFILGGMVIVVGIVVWSAPRWFNPASTANTGPRELMYVVPRGTIANQGLGATVSVLPSQVELTVGRQDTLIIRNEDLYPIEVAGVLIHPGQQYKQQFTRAGEYDLVCSVHTGDKIREIGRAHV